MVIIQSHSPTCWKTLLCARFIALSSCNQCQVVSSFLDTMEFIPKAPVWPLAQDGEKNSSFIDPLRKIDGIYIPEDLQSTPLLNFSTATFVGVRE